MNAILEQEYEKLIEASMSECVEIFVPQKFYLEVIEAETCFVCRKFDLSKYSDFFNASYFFAYNNETKSYAFEQINKNAISYHKFNSSTEAMLFLHNSIASVTID